MRGLPERCRSLFRQLIVSCQASEGDAFRDAESMARFARAAEQAGAAGIRANGPEDIRAIRQAVTLPIIGIQKRLHEDGRILITPSIEDACNIVAAGADIVAIDCTARGQRYGALDRLQRARSELGVPVMADVATVEEAGAAAQAGADIVASTMRGYTQETESVRAFEPAFIRELCAAVDVPVAAEGRIDTPQQAAEAIRAGAYTVIVGTAITRPQVIAACFVQALEAERERVGAAALYIGIDLGGTNTKCAVISHDGQMTCEFAVATPPGGGRHVLLGHLKAVARRGTELARSCGVAPTALGIATAGWVDPASGCVAYATENLPGWTGTAIADELERECGLPVAVENDANALAVAERYFGAGRGVDDFVCITLGTGVGGGCYTGGQLNRGAHFFANALGHIPIQHNGLPCTCGNSGCLEAYSNAAALMRYAGGRFPSSEAVISAANNGDEGARRALSEYSEYLATGIAVVVHLLDPSAVILSGGIAQNNPLLIRELQERLSRILIASRQRKLQLRVSPLGYYGGVFGAAAIALEKFRPQGRPSACTSNTGSAIRK